MAWHSPTKWRSESLGTPDTPGSVQVGGVEGDTVRLVFSGHEALDCGGFAELEVIALE